VLPSAYTTSPENGVKSSFPIALICTARRRIQASASTNQGPETGDLVAGGRTCSPAEVPGVGAERGVRPPGGAPDRESCLSFESCLSPETGKMRDAASQALAHAPTVASSTCLHVS